MITAIFSNHDEIRYLKLLVKGHAGSDVKGRDLVCASASILLYALAQAVADMEERGELMSSPIIVTEEDKGDALITCQCISDKSYSDAVSAFNVIRTGFKLLAHNYPQYVELNTVGSADKA